MKFKQYIIGLVDGSAPYGFSILTRKGKSYKSLKEANRMKKQHEWVEVLPVIILQKTYEVVK